MNDHRPHPDDDALELASAYLDDVLDPAGRATVEGSPDLLDLVAALRWARDLVIDATSDGHADELAPAQSDPRRDAAIAAALGVFDTEIVPVVAPAERHATIAPLRAARRWHRPVMLVSAAAAGLLLVGIAAGSLGGTIGGDDMDMSGSAENSDSRVATQVADGEALTATASTPVGGGIATETSPVATIDTIIGPASVPTVIDDSVVLLELAGQVLGPEWLSGDLSTVIPPPADLDLFGCTPTLSPSQLIIATITYVDQPALAVADLATKSVRAIDLGCNVLAEATYTG
jgi:hypothetical protein